VHSQHNAFMVVLAYVFYKKGSAGFDVSNNLIRFFVIQKCPI